MDFFFYWLTFYFMPSKKQFFQPHFSIRHIPLKISTSKEMPQYQKWIYRVENYKDKYQWSWIHFLS